MKKWDVIIFITAFVIFLCLTILMIYNKQEGGVVIVSVDGVQKAVYPLNEDRSVRINGYDDGYNELVIKDHRAFITDADCPDKSCVHQKPIGMDHETIICLPHRVVIEIETPKENEVDAVAR